jgi:hypothetical protein
MLITILATCFWLLCSFGYLADCYSCGDTRPLWNRLIQAAIVPITSLIWLIRIAAQKLEGQ